MHDPWHADLEQSSIHFGSARIFLLEMSPCQGSHFAHQKIVKQLLKSTSHGALIHSLDLRF